MDDTTTSKPATSREELKARLAAFRAPPPAVQEQIETCGTSPKLPEDLITSLHVSVAFQIVREESRALSTRRFDDCRYKDGSVDSLQRDFGPEVRLLWTEDEYPDTVSAEAAIPKLGDDQVDMPYFLVQVSPDGISDLVVNPPRLDNGVPIHRDQTRLPVNVRADDGYLGAIWLASTGANIFQMLPFDVDRDGYPYPDRACCGNAFRPRHNQKDFPKDGTWHPNKRIAPQCVDFGLGLDLVDRGWEGIASDYMM